MKNLKIHSNKAGRDPYESGYDRLRRMLRGSFWVLILYDIAEQIQLDRLRGILGVEAPRREPSFKHPAPDYVRFERAPVVEFLDPVSIAGAQFLARLKYFDYGVVSVMLELQFETDWPDLVRLSQRWVASPEIEKQAGELVRSRLGAIKPALIQPYSTWLSEDYYVIHLSEAGDISAQAMLDEHGAEIAQMVRGESNPLSEGEQKEVLQSSLSYYANDLLVVGWVAALVYDSPEDAEPAIQLLEYANTQLLEYRHYDDVLTGVLEGVYKAVEQHGGILRQWRMGRRAGELNALRLDVTELTERTDTSIKFLSDMFYARAYRLAAARVGVGDYRNLVERKLRIASDLYEFMVNEFHQGRSFLLEVMVVAILIIELIHLFRYGV